MLRCVIVDDEPLAVQLLENYVSRTDFLDLESSWNDPVKALSHIRETVPELVFLDIQMPDLDGLELARMLPADTRVIFTTAFKEYALDSYEVCAVDFLLKPIRYQKFLEATEKARTWFDMKQAAKDNGSAAMDGSLFLKSDGEYLKISLQEITYVEGMKDYILVHTLSRKQALVVHMTMKAAEGMLPAASFMRVHRSFIVNLDHIDSVSADGDICIAETFIPVSDSYSEAFSAFVKSHRLG